MISFPSQTAGICGPIGENEVDLIGQERLYGSGSAAHEDELHIQSLALVKTFFRANHHWKNLYAGRRECAANRLAGGLI